MTAPPAAPSPARPGRTDPDRAAAGDGPRISVEIGVIEVVEDDPAGHLDAAVRPPLSLTEYLRGRAVR